MGVDLKSANGKGVFLVEVTYRQNGAIVILIDIFLRFRKSFGILTEWTVFKLEACFQKRNMVTVKLNKYLIA